VPHLLSLFFLPFLHASLSPLSLTVCPYTLSFSLSLSPLSLFLSPSLSPSPFPPSSPLSIFLSHFLCWWRLTGRLGSSKLCQLSLNSDPHVHTNSDKTHTRTQ